ncbi:hypothetical protein H2204_002807 [Knufia peltigerae]|uniref:Uncharacterized protein n=1 Tax=Knufia peltigerae TaxID=1002370 RepID=A0AA39D099_9EURO|nr:hypothetical protein H2204_002807 [Knufia peltigerae]
MSLTNSRDDVDGRREIQQHAQKSRDYNKERERRRKLKRSRVPIGWTYISPAPSRCHSLSHLAMRPAVSVSEVRESDTIKQTILKSTTTSPEEDDRNDDKQPQHECGSLSMQIPNWGSVEPFAQFKLSMNAEKYRMLEYFVFRHFPAVTRSDMSVLSRRSTLPPSNRALQFVRNALNEELHTLALLAVASARMKYVDRTYFAQADLPEQLADAALRLTRAYLAQGRPITQQLITSILFLWAVESYRRNWDGVRIHGNMIMYLTNTFLGGFQTLDLDLRRMLWIADRFQAAATQTPPLIEDRWETDELSHQQRVSATAAVRGQGREVMGGGLTNQQVGESVLFTPKFQGLLDKVLDLCCVIQCHWIGVPEDTTMPDRDWALARAWSIADELIAFKDDSAPSSRGRRSLNDHSRRLQDCVRLALIAWLAFVPASAFYAPTSKDKSAPTVRATIDARPLRNRLGSILQNHLKQAPSEKEQVLLFWVAAVGAVVSELVENQEWFGVKFQSTARKLNIFTWRDFVPVNERFLLLQYLQPGNLSKLSWLLQRAVYAETRDCLSQQDEGDKTSEI